MAIKAGDIVKSKKGAKSSKSVSLTDWIGSRRKGMKSSSKIAAKKRKESEDEDDGEE